MNLLGKYILIGGIIMIFIGIILIYKDHLPFMKYPGNLPGDVKIEKENFKFYFPVATSILLSLILTLLLNLARKFFK